MAGKGELTDINNRGTLGHWRQVKTKEKFPHDYQIIQSQEEKRYEKKKKKKTCMYCRVEKRRGSGESNSERSGEEGHWFER